MSFQQIVMHDGKAKHSLIKEMNQNSRNGHKRKEKSSKELKQRSQRY